MSCPCVPTEQPIPMTMGIQRDTQAIDWTPDQVGSGRRHRQTPRFPGVMRDSLRGIRGKRNLCCRRLVRQTICQQAKREVMLVEHVLDSLLKPGGVILLENCPLSLLEPFEETDGTE